MNNKIFLRAFKDSLPILFAYGPLGVVFGVLFENEGYLWVLGPLMSLLVYAGAVQFLAVAMIGSEAFIGQILLTCFFIAFRNSFYGQPFFERFSKFNFLARNYLKFGLVDATYAILLSKKPDSDVKKDEKYCICLGVLLHSYWVVGTIIGGAAGKAIPEIKGLEFVLTILFAIFTIDQYLKLKKFWPFAVAIIGWSLMQIISPHYALLGGITFSIIVYSFALKLKIVKI